ncbi:hypothetical protein F2Q70_00027875 [Brassica cretica]|uniref:PPPDE domain-containing protein n=1 Tax=Brassica cretica TaxID=69181 RepID=A0A8S9L478_BRACR|nr:hypothetical protein F2Q70_00027875 [Brassica cretica]
MLCWKGSSVRRKEKTALLPVYLNVYDLTPMNAYGYWLGLGVFHSGVEGQFLFLGFGWVLCNCVLPPRFNETKVRRVVQGELSEEERKKRRNRSRSGPLLSTSSSSSTPDSHRSHIRAKSTGNNPTSSTSSSTSGSKKSKKQCAPPTAPRAPDQKSPSVSVKT